MPTRLELQFDAARLRNQSGMARRLRLPPGISNNHRPQEWCFDFDQARDAALAAGGPFRPKAQSAPDDDGRQANNQCGRDQQSCAVRIRDRFNRIELPCFSWKP